MTRQLKKWTIGTVGLKLPSFKKDQKLFEKLVVLNKNVFATKNTFVIQRGKKTHKILK